MIRFLASLIPPWAWVSLLALSVATAYGWHRIEVHRAVREVRAEVERERRDAMREAARIEEQRTRLAKEAGDAARQTLQRAKADAAAAHDAYVSLRDTIGRHATDAGAAEGADGADSTGVLLGECAQEVARLAAAADRASAVARGLQAYVGGVCLAK